MNTNPAEKSDTAYSAFRAAFSVGLMDAILFLIFNVIYRQYAPEFSSDLLNGSILIAGTIILFSLTGLVYLLVIHVLKLRLVVYMILFIVLSILGQLAIQNTQFSGDALQSQAIRGELASIITIYEVSAVFGIPLLHKRSSSL